MDSLSFMNLASNQLSVLPESICFMTRLGHLDMSNNVLRDLPENIGRMKQLRHFNVQNNLLWRLRREVGQIHDTIKEILYDGNDLKAPPQEIIVLGPKEMLR